MNSVGVKQYSTIDQGIAATSQTMQNGRYPRIVGNLQQSIPQNQWGNAGPDLKTWGTGTGWLASTGFAGLGRASAAVAGAAQPACITSINLPLTGAFCLDAAIGGIVIGAGGLVVLAGVFVLVATSMKHASVGQASASALRGVTSPARALVERQQVRRTQAQTQKITAAQQAKQAATEAHTQTIRRAQVRTVRARARAAEAQARASKVA
jgi:hypothetical protein